MILVVQAGFDTGRQVRLDRGIITIGRGVDCDVMLQERLASRRHAELRRFGDQWLIVDLGSTNGTYLGDSRLESHVPRSLPPGAQVVIGNTRFALREEPPDAAAPVLEPRAQAWEAVPAPPSHPQAPWAEDPAQAEAPSADAIRGGASPAAREAIVWLCRLLVVAGCGLMSLGTLRDWLKVEVRTPLVGTVLYEQTYSGVDSAQAWLYLVAAAVAISLILLDIALPRWGLVSGLGQMSVGIVVLAANAVNLFFYYRAATQEFLGISLMDLFDEFTGELIDITMQTGVYLLAMGLALLILGGVLRLVLVVTSSRKT